MGSRQATIMSVIRRVVLLSLCLGGEASAWEPGVMTPVSTDSEIEAIAMGVWRGQPRVVVATQKALLILDPSGAELSRRSGLVSDVLLEDLDGDGDAELVGCGPEGLFVIRGIASAPGEPHFLSRTACEAVVRYASEEPYASVVSAAGGVVTVWRPEDSEIVGHPWEGTYVGDVLLRSVGDTFAIASRGVSGIQEGAARGRSLFATADPVRAMVAGPTGWTWLTESETPEIRDLSRSAVSVDASARDLLAVDLEGRGLVVLVLHPQARSVGFLVDGVEERIAVPIRPQVVAAGDLDGDGCAEWAVVDGREGAVIWGDCGRSDEKVLAVAPSVDTEKTPEASMTPVDSDPRELMIGEEHAPLRVQVGTSVDFQLRSSYKGSRTWSVRGGPDGLNVTRGGHLTYTAQASHVGLWSVSLRVREGAAGRWSGIDLEVVEADPAEPTPSE
jgi:hypothetical protein